MITGSNPYPISHDSGHPEIDATGTGYNPADAAAQWDAAIADGAITKVELEQHPELAHHIEVTLGYGSIDVFLMAHRATGSVGSMGALRPSGQSIEAIDASISGSLDGGVQYTEGSSNVLPTNIDPDSTFVVYTLRSGKKITFDGPRAGTMANEFGKIYNNSPTFRQAISTLAGRQGGQYSFHSAPLPTSVTGSNIAGTDGRHESSGVFIQSDPSVEINMAKTIIHEVIHDQHHEDHGGLDDAGAVHSREQTIAMSTIVNEIKENGEDIGIDVDGDDYSHNSLIFDGDYKTLDDTSSGAVTSNDVVFDENGTEVNALDYYTTKYTRAKVLLSQGRHQEAKAILDQIPPDAKITIQFEDQQSSGGKRAATYNVRKLMLQDLMFASDSSDRFDTGLDVSPLKRNTGIFLSVLAHDGTWGETIKSAAADINFDLHRELLFYKPPQTDAERLQTRQEFFSAWSV